MRHTMILWSLKRPRQAHRQILGAPRQLIQLVHLYPFRKSSRHRQLTRNSRNPRKYRPLKSRPDHSQKDPRRRMRSLKLPLNIHKFPTSHQQGQVDDQTMDRLRSPRPLHHHKSSSNQPSSSSSSPSNTHRPVLLPSKIRDLSALQTRLSMR